MDRDLLTVFRVELLSQCELAQIAAAQLEGAHEKAAAGQLRSEDEFWVAIQSILVIAANAAKLLWGSRGSQSETTRRPLRDLAQVDEDSALKPRDVRNRFEHFDEYIEDWYQHDLKVYVSREITVDDAEWPPDKARFGRYNPQTRIVTFWDREVSITYLLAELERIRLTLRSN